MKNLKEKTLKGFIWLLFGSGIQVTVQIAVLAILARIISKEDFGVAQSALIVIGFSNLLSQLGVGPAIVQKKELTQDLLRSGFTISLVSGTILGIIVYLGAGALSSFFNMPALKEILQVVSVLFVLQSMVVISEGLMQRNMQMKQLATSNFISYTLGYGVVAVTLGYHNYGVWAIIYGSISQTIVKGIIVSIYQPHSYRPYFNKKDYYELLHYGGGFTIARFANYFAGQGDNIVAGKYLGAYALGIYSRAFGIMVKPVNLIGTAIDKVLFPAMASRQDDREKLISAFLKGSQLMHSVALPIGLMIAIAAKDIIVVLLGKTWLEVTVPLQILSVGLLFKMSYKMGDSLARSTGLIYKRALRQIVFAISMVVFSYCGHFYGINGIAVGIFLLYSA